MEGALLAGRIVFGLMFLVWGLNHFLKLNAMAAYAQAEGVPAPKLAIAGTGLMLVWGALSILLGLYTWIGATVLIVMLVPVTLKMHRFWGITDPMLATNQMTHFMKNVTLVGALLLVTYFGSGPLSLT